MSKQSLLNEPLLAILIIILFWASSGHCTTSGNNRPNSLGIEQYYTNPNEYLFAVPIDGTLLHNEKDQRFTSIRFQPFNTMSLYDETVLFCGDVLGDFTSKKGPLVITYDRIAHKALKGIGCHELDAVFEVPPPPEGKVMQ